MSAASGSAQIDFVLANSSASWIDYGLSVTYGNRVEVPSGAGPKSVFVGWLGGATTYHYRIGFQSSNGPSATSDHSFTTPADAYQWATGADAEVHPGAFISGPCTLAFIFRDATNSSLYAATAGHCVDFVGQDVYLQFAAPGYPLIGKVVAFEYEANTNVPDWALVKILDSARGSVSPLVAHWTGPTGPNVPGGTKYDATVCHYGRNSGSALSYHRCGRYEADSAGDANSFAFRGTSGGGDSGSPVIDYATGRALGVLVAAQANNGQVSTPQPTFATHLCVIIARAAAFGFEVRLATGVYAPPPADSTQPIGTSVPYTNVKSCASP